MKKIFFALGLIILAATASAADYSCVQYQRQDSSWGEAYKVPYTIIKGEDLQKATNDYRRYKTYTKYAVVEWPNGGYSAMELASYQDDVSDYSYTRTKDQSGRTYRIKKAPSYGECSRY